MQIILTFFGVIIGVIVAILLIAGFIYLKLKKSIGSSNMKEFINIAKNAKSIQQEEYCRVKSISGMTGLLESEIRRDVPEFNSNLLFSKVQSNLTKIFNSITVKSVDELLNDEDFVLILPSVKKTIEEQIEISYKDIDFHDFAIKKYNRGTGVATITVATNVGYYYSNSSNKRNDEYKSLKKETRYTCDFVYIYDESKFESNQKGFTISCPNCGAPINKLHIGHCEYCSSAITPINLKLWKMSSYKEDYKLAD